MLSDASVLLRFLFVWSVSALGARAQSCPQQVCNIGGFDFAPLYWACNSDSKWQYRMPTNQTLGSSDPSSTATTFYFNLCNISNPVAAGCSADTAVCRVSSGTGMSIGNRTAIIANPARNAEVSLTLTGNSCAGGSLYKTFIYFKCGKSLGSPVLLDVYDCSYYFEWVSSVACRSSRSSNATEREISCYLYDINNKIRDLTPLIRAIGGHQTHNVGSGEKVIFNVCRNIAGDILMPGCTGSVCLLDSQGQLTTFGNIDDGTSLLLANRSAMLWLHYTAPGTTSSCPTRSASITFVCPVDGENKDPILLSRDECALTIEWQTDYACPSGDLTSSTCQLTTRGGDDIDLTPLSSIVYNVTTGEYTYSIGICGTTTKCNGEQAAACQHATRSGPERLLGKPRTQLLRYADGDLSLRYREGDRCNNGYAREIILNFHCNLTAAGSYPEFDMENNCTYLFDWDTPYACTNDPNDIPCACTSGDKNFDLSRLIKIDRNWEVIQPGSSSNTANGSSIFINVCHNLVKDSRENSRVSSCHPAASACLVYSNGTAVNLGAHVDRPAYSELTNSIELTYRGGSACGSGRAVESRIRFVCKPGDLVSSPVLIDISDDECTYFFEWRTAAACVEVNVSQDGCRIYDESLGLDYSLAGLRQADKDYSVRVTGRTNYTYYINVCGPLVGTNNGKCTGAGACQIADEDGRAFKIGNASSVLTYSQGRLQLSYQNGDPYNDNAKTPRRTLIMFLCDPEAGLGTPEYISESNRTYLFYWSTREACLETIVQCMVTSGGKQFDLSSLSRAKFEDNWAVIIGGPGTDGRKKIYMNVCRPVNYEPDAGCSATAAACIVNVNGTRETPDVRSLGEPTEGPTIVGNALILTYSNGGDCRSDSGNLSYSTKIHFICVHGKSGSGPRFVSEMNDICQYTFIWEDEAACPLTADEYSNSCHVTDPKTGYTFNLDRLASENKYTYTDGSTKYELSICRPLNDGVCGVGAAVCVNGTVYGNASNSQLHVVPGGNLQLIYNGGANGIKTEVHFSCSYAGQHNLTGSEIVGKTLHLYFTTDAVCYPDPGDCFVTDSSGNQYDLSPLSNNGASWTAFDTNRPNDTFFLSICSPLNRTGDAADCPGGAISGCFVASNGQAPQNLGYMLGEPTVAIDGAVLISLTNGSACTDGPGQTQAKIKLFCSQVESGPEFYSKAGCEYTFYWYTPQACPIKTQVGSDCAVVDPISGVHFDLSALRKNGSHYNVTFGKYTYLINLCGGIGPAGASGSGQCSASTGVCQKVAPQSGYNAGQANGNLTLEGGILKLNYTDGTQCRNGPARSTVLVFICDPQASGDQGPRFINETSCQYWFEWYTSAACAVRQTPCSVRLNNGSVYDLSRMALPASNYIVDASAIENRTYYINVCRNLVFGVGMVGCPADAAACYKDTNTNKFVSIGRVGRGSPVKHLFGEMAVLEYDHGETCPYDKSKNFTTDIMVVCDPSKEVAVPSVVENRDDPCNIFFVWRHAAGCVVKSSESVSGRCALTSSTGYEFDLSPLKNLYTVTTHDSTFYLDVCGMNGTTPCGSGVCVVEQNGNRTVARASASAARLEYIGGLLTMSYITDAACPRGGNRSVVISFACNSGAVGAPVYLGDTDDCAYQFSWRTAYACTHEAMPCSVAYGSSVIDLSPLSRKAFYPAASRVDALSYYVSVCRPLGTVPNVAGCSPGSTVCATSPANRTARQSLGNVGASPRMNPSTGRIELHYASRSTCRTAAAAAAAVQTTSATIVFRCSSRADLVGNPVLVSISSECEYVFEWETSVVCLRNVKPNSGKDCKVIDSSGHEFDLSPLRNDSSSYTIKTGSYEYMINVCGRDSAVQLCPLNGREQCRELGRSHEGGLVLQPGAGGIILQYARSGSCSRPASESGGSGVMPQIMFECDDDGDVPGQPSVVVADQCSPLFVWRTPLACKPQLARDCVIHFGDSNYDLQPLSRSSGYWTASYKSTVPDGKDMTFYINVCESIGPDNGPLAGVAVALNKSDPVLTTIGLLRTQRVFYDGASLVLGYTRSTFNCTTLPEAHARILFSCGPHLGSPVYNSYDDKCAYVFTWTTHLMCPGDRQEATESNGRVFDPVGNTTMELTSLLDGIYQISAEDVSDYMFIFMLRGAKPDRLSKLKYRLDSCENPSTIVCMINLKDTTVASVPIGLLSRRKFYFKDGLLQAVIGSSFTCDDTGVTAESIIDFHCDRSRSDDYIKFTYKSNGCQYIFDWYTPVVCEDATSAADADSNVSPDLPAHHLSGGAIVGIVLAAVTVVSAVTAFGVLKLRRRRASLLGASATAANYGSESSIGYSQLQASEDQLSISNGDRQLGSLQYNDDSDVDLLI